METILNIKNLRVFYQTKKSEILAVNNLCFKAVKGEFIAIIGRSGCGKTSILSVIAGLLPYLGEVTLLNKKIEKPNFGIGYMLQRDELFPWLTIEQNAILPLKINGIKTKERFNYVNHLFEKYGLKEFKKHYPSQLSGGMRQRAALIRTLSANPELLLLDEPFSALDYQTKLTVCNDVYKIIKSEGKTAILVTHDISEAISLADKIIVLTARPASVYSENIINLDKNLTPLQRREQPEFSVWFEKLWGELNAWTNKILFHLKENDI